MTTLRNLGWHLWPRMTEEKWRTSDDAVVMLDYALGRTSARKFRLFAAACWRRFHASRVVLPNEIEAAEQYADGLLSAEAVARMRHLNLLSDDARWAAYTILRYTPWHTALLPVDPHELADLLRHIVGNPFRPVPPLERPSTTLSQLAEAVYAGESCAFALRDALLDAGHADLAEHFQHDGHPKGCWAVDVLLSKE